MDVTKGNGYDKGRHVAGFGSQQPAIGDAAKVAQAQGWVGWRDLVFDVWHDEVLARSASAGVTLGVLVGLPAGWLVPEPVLERIGVAWYGKGVGLRYCPRKYEAVTFGDVRAASSSVYASAVVCGPEERGSWFVEQVYASLGEEEGLCYLELMHHDKRVDAYGMCGLFPPIGKMLALCGACLLPTAELAERSMRMVAGAAHVSDVGDAVEVVKLQSTPLVLVGGCGGPPGEEEAVSSPGSPPSFSVPSFLPLGEEEKGKEKGAKREGEKRMDEREREKKEKKKKKKKPKEKRQEQEEQDRLIEQVAVLLESETSLLGTGCCTRLSAFGGGAGCDACRAKHGPPVVVYPDVRKQVRVRGAEQDEPGGLDAARQCIAAVVAGDEKASVLMVRGEEVVRRDDVVRVSEQEMRAVSVERVVGGTELAVTAEFAVLVFPAGSAVEVAGVAVAATTTPVLVAFTGFTYLRCVLPRGVEYVWARGYSRVGGVRWLHGTAKMDPRQTGARLWSASGAKVAVLRFGAGEASPAVVPDAGVVGLGCGEEVLALCKWRCSGLWSGLCDCKRLYKPLPWVGLEVLDEGGDVVGRDGIGVITSSCSGSYAVRCEPGMLDTMVGERSLQCDDSWALMDGSAVASRRHVLFFGPVVVGRGVAVYVAPFLEWGCKTYGCEEARPEVHVLSVEDDYALDGGGPSGDEFDPEY